MSNNKKRTLTFHPTHFRFGPLNSDVNEFINLEKDELEALYLADFKNLYQEACAESLGVSRPTFAKILKSARAKTIKMLMYAKGLEIQHEAHVCVLIFPTNDRISISPHFLIAKHFAFATIEASKIVSIAYKDNPIYRELEEKGIEIIDDNSAQGLSAGRLIPPLFKDGSLLAVKSVGEGIQRNIEGLGISIKLTDDVDIEKVVESI